MQRFLKPVVLIALVLALLGVAFFLLTRDRNNVLHLGSFTEGTGTGTKGYNLKTIQIESPKGILVKVKGYFADPLYYSNDYLMGDFVIENDPEQAPQRILIVGKNGNFTMGRGDGTEIKWQLVADSELLKAVKAKQPTELRFVFYDNDENTSSQEMKQRLEQLSNDGQLTPNEYQLTPTMIGIGVIND